MANAHPHLIPNGASVTDEARSLLDAFAPGGPTVGRPHLLSLAEAAVVVPLSEKTLRRAAQDEGPPFLKVKNRWMIFEDELHKWVRERAAEAAAEDDPEPRRRRARRPAATDSMAAVLAEEPA
jgi:hypothetical protein